MNEQAQALKLLSEGWDIFIWFPTGYDKYFLLSIAAPVMDYKLGRINAALVDRSVVFHILCFRFRFCMEGVYWSLLPIRYIPNGN